ncbi:hypothetical protein PMZ80_008069 [Knufia obscura]|uniref:Calcineurin-like phosphoesterase domain-containing protein n=1 Tax=Knufia obscura TaxID=1635080 RepID=A0ABR0RGE7_9EURO|nr:hypothetical protein PMZ80_008069 [Knufia obscura]
MRLHKVAAALSACITTIQAIQPGAAPAQEAPLRDLELGDLNFLHTTDTHGWHAGHLLEPSFSADWGDYISFTEHMREKLEAEGRDLLVIDTGDRIEGNGLYDASNPRGEYTFGIFSQQHIDILCSGNHELYKNSSAEDDYTKLVPAYKDNYLASNLEIIDPKTRQVEPLAPRYRTFTTKHGVKIMAFGFIFDFTRNDKNTIVIPVEQAVKYPWFQTAIATADIDLFVVIGHVALRSQEFEVIHRAIRTVKPNTPIQFFGGHYHIRDYRIFDNKAHALASGRFMETIGFQSITNLKSDTDNITFARRYIDNNLHSLMHHSNTTPSTFPTPLGLNTSRMITHARTALNLDQTFGCAPNTYWMSRTPYPSPTSIFTLLTEHIFPSIINPHRRNATRLILTNTGAIRFDIFAGPFTRDSTYIVSPFTSNLSFIPDVPYRLARHLLPILNGQDPQTGDLAFTGSTINNPTITSYLTELPPPEQQSRNAALLYHAAQQQSQSRSYRPTTQEQLDLNDAMSNDPAWEKFLQAQNNNDATALEAAVLELTQRFSSKIADSYSRQRFSPPSLSSLASDSPTHDHNHDHKAHLGTKEVLTPGYTTHDDLGDTGDDTLRSPITFYDVPNCVQAVMPGTHVYNSVKDAEENGVVDLVFNHFLAPYVLTILNTLSTEQTSTPSPSSSPTLIEMEQEGDGDVEDRIVEDRIVTAEAEVEAQVQARKYTEDDITNYIPGETFTSLLAKWVSENWKENCKEEDELKRETCKEGNNDIKTEL